MATVRDNMARNSSGHRGYRNGSELAGEWRRQSLDREPVRPVASTRSPREVRDHDAAHDDRVDDRPCRSMPDVGCPDEVAAEHRRPDLRRPWLPRLGAVWRRRRANAESQTLRGRWLPI